MAMIDDQIPDQLDDSSTLEEGDATPPKSDDEQDADDAAQAAALAAQQAQEKPPAPYQPQFAKSGLSTEERAKLKGVFTEAFDKWDPDTFSETLINVVDDLSGKRSQAALDNYMAARVQTSGNQREALADQILMQAAREDPNVLNDPTARDLAQISAAMRIGSQRGDVKAALREYLDVDKPAPREERQEQREQPRARGVDPAMSLPSAGSQSAGDRGRRAGSTATSVAGRVLDYLPKGGLDILMEEG
jgi:hypothetical protein